jgi:hypothetical protein
MSYNYELVAPKTIRPKRNDKENEAVVTRLIIAGNQ